MQLARLRDGPPKEAMSTFLRPRFSALCRRSCTIEEVFEQVPEPEYLATTSSAVVKDFSSQNSGGSSSGLLFVQSVGLPDCRWQIRW